MLSAGPYTLSGVEASPGESVGESVGKHLILGPSSACACEGWAGAELGELSPIPQTELLKAQSHGHGQKEPM